MTALGRLSNLSATEDVGSYKNRKVAIKCLRIYSTDDPVETTKVSQNKMSTVRF